MISTNSWVKNNLNGILKIGLSTKEIRDKYKVIGQPLTIILDQNGEVVYREYGYIPVNGFNNLPNYKHFIDEISNMRL